MTKPTDRFVLKWIQCNLSARISPRLTGIEWMRPWMITVASMVPPAVCKWMRDWRVPERLRETGGYL
jgi:hypothetical protein